jgi:hypothetical protein
MGAGGRRQIAGLTATVMAELSVDGGDVVLRMTGWERLGSGRAAGELRFPRSSVAGVTTCTPAFDGVRGLRIMGTGVPGTIALGTRRVSGGLREFVVVHGRDPGSVLVDLVDQRYARLVVSVADPEAVAAQLR